MLKPITKYFDDRAAWLANRPNYIGASEVPCLFGHGYNTYFQLWHEKSGLIDPENLDDVLPVIVGECMEAGFADVIRKTTDYTLRKTHRYLIYGDEKLRLGASLDYEIQTEDAGWVPAELKILDYPAFADKWEETEATGEYDPPLIYALQLQTQLLITGKPYGYLFALVGNKQVIENRMEADPEVQGLIIKLVAEFWDSIEKQTAPAPDYDNDLAIMFRVMTNVDAGLELHVHGEELFEQGMIDYRLAADREKAAKEMKEHLRAAILDRLGPAIRAKCNNGTISAKVTERWGKPRRELRITPKKGITQNG
jgi:predicted phage-related endonuclease